MKLFDSVQFRRPKRNKFDLSHEKKMSLNMGKLIPIVVQEVLPGDSFRINSEIMLRFAPMIAPVMHRVNVTTHYYFVPNRLTYVDWEDFITGGRLGTSAAVPPTIPFDDDTIQNFVEGSLADYMGIPTIDPVVTPSVSAPIQINALPFRAYQLIYNEYYRDQNLTPPVEFQKTGGVQGAGEADIIMAMKQRAWEKDYFTSALPWAQRGSDVNIPFGDASVTYLDEAILFNPNLPSVGPIGDIAGFNAHPDPDNPGDEISNIMVPGSNQLQIRNIDTISASGTITELRRSIRLQEWLEKNAVGGARYKEHLKIHFGVNSSDARLQRPEYLGGGRTPVVISEVLSTAQAPIDGGAIPQGNMAGHGVSFGTTNGFKRTFEEHGYIIGIMSVLPKTAYQEGVPRHFSRIDKLDYAFPEFAQIGEQEILQKEILYQPGGGVPPSGVFGYQSRYAEYKYQPSTVHGEMRSSLAFWHMGRIFGTDAPSLNTTFVESTPTDRIFAVEDEDADKLYCHMFNHVSAIRPLPYFGTPTI